MELGLPFGVNVQCVCVEWRENGRKGDDEDNDDDDEHHHFSSLQYFTQVSGL